MGPGKRTEVQSFMREHRDTGSAWHAGALAWIHTHTSHGEAGSQQEGADTWFLEPIWKRGSEVEERVGSPWKFLYLCMNYNIAQSLKEVRENLVWFLHCTEVASYELVELEHKPRHFDSSTLRPTSLLLLTQAQDVELSHSLVDFIRIIVQPR